MKSALVLEDGSFFEGASVGVHGEKIGEVVLNTAVVGYQEMMTDPANAGKILVFTYPLIGNYGAAKKFYESKKCWVEAVVMKQDSRIASNFQAEGTFQAFLKKEEMVALSDVDTRTLAVKIRDDGEMLGIVSTKGTNTKNLLKKLNDYKKRAGKSYIKDISVQKITQPDKKTSGANIAVLDLGITNSVIKQLQALGCSLTLLPFDTAAEKILELKQDGLVISNGPEKDPAIQEIAGSIKKLLGKIPVLGISAGHEVIALALGGKLKKLNIGHRGANYPVKGVDSYKGEITVQNHSLVVDEGSIKGRPGVKITLKNINDGTIEEMESASLKFISTQYCPASPGFDEVNPVFEKFLGMTKKNLKNNERNLTCQNVKT